MNKLIGVNKRVENNGKRIIWQATVRKMINGNIIRFKKDAPFTEEGMYKCGIFYNIITRILNGKKAKQNFIPDKYKHLFSLNEIQEIENKVLQKYQLIKID